jgi:adenylate kinase
MLPNIHILGVQGSGKGTQAALLEKRYQITALATGQLFRERAEHLDSFGQEIAEALHAGKLLSDAYLVRAVSEYLESHPVERGLLGDGVIRTLAQYDQLVPVWQQHNLDQPFLIHLDLSDDVARERIHERAQHAAVIRPDDATPEAINQRITHFHTLTEPILTRFGKTPQCVTIDASPSVEVVFASITAVLEQRFPTLTPV